MEKINFTDATLTTQAKVTIDGTDHEITPAVYTGGTNLDASTFNTMQDNIESYVNKNILMLNLSQRQNVTTSTETKVLFNVEKQKIGNKLTFENNSIKIGAGVSKVRVDLTLWIENNYSDSYCGFYIVKNDISQTYNIKQHIAGANWDTGNAFTILDVQEGDYISSKVRFSVASGSGELNCIAGSYENSCNLCVEVIE